MKIIGFAAGMLGAAAGLVALPAGTALAQDGWEFAVTPYVWLPGIKTDVGKGDFGPVGTETSTSDALSNLDFAFMGAVEARKDRWGIIADLLYVDLSSSQDTPLGIFFDKAETDTKMLAFSGYAAYRVFENDQASIDVLGGFRYYDTRVGLTLTEARRPERDFTLKESWVDPVIGARGRYAFNDKWWGQAAFDYGGFDGSNDSTWQALGTVGYQFNPAWSLQGGYRYMDIQKEMNGLDVQVELSGPIIGFTYRF